MNISCPVLEENYVINISHAEPLFRALKESHLIENEREYYICGKIFELISLLKGNATADNQTQKYVLRAKNYIDVNFANTVTIEKMADDLNLNRSYLSTIFKRYFGISPPNIWWTCDWCMRHSFCRNTVTAFRKRLSDLNITTFTTFRKCSKRNTECRRRYTQNSPIKNSVWKTPHTHPIRCF